MADPSSTSSARAKSTVGRPYLAVRKGERDVGEVLAKRHLLSGKGVNVQKRSGRRKKWGVL